MPKNETGGTTWRQATRLVRGGTARSAFAETCEALFMTYIFYSPSTDETSFVRQWAN